MRQKREQVSAGWISLRAVFMKFERPREGLTFRQGYLILYDLTRFFQVSPASPPNIIALLAITVPVLTKTI